MWIRNNFKTIPLENVLRARTSMKCARYLTSYATSWRKADKRHEGRYNLVYLIEKVSEFDLKNVPVETLTEDDKKSLQEKANTAIEDCYKTRWSKKKESKECLQAHQNEYSDPKRDTWMFKNGK